MTHTVAIITGASRGLGAALAFGLAREGTHLITFARNLHPELARHALAQGCQLEEHTVDLSHPMAMQAAAARMAIAMPRNAQRYLLINNAGTLGPVGPAGLQPAEQIAAAFNVNVTAAMVLTGHFLQATEGLTANRRILHISSGAARRPTASWSVYCASKAALDMHARTVKLEQGPHGARIVSLAPGVIDTPMQAGIRATPSQDFPDLARFQALHDEGKLATPEATAARVLAYLERDDFGATEVDDIRHY
ncbi:SDR family oxidoreductase [Verticiella sediminum]|uniref:SDR family oxidoreductase n=1 Tax=Verticiella sediminum TaxID=1247510 RepID=A0A556AYT1_9BURK|nr:SDR family oxidoreductase [Verticiella sediminum]TSH98104.1 SDR family oxidoreductase [Verticiella sediminum]